MKVITTFPLPHSDILATDAQFRPRIKARQNHYDPPAEHSGFGGPTNRMKFRRIERPTLIEFDHGVDSDDDPGRFRTTITFDEQGDSKTVITLRQLHPTKAKRDAGIGFGAVEYGYQKNSRDMSMP
jgi:uncharacterized protein YndB with AHSA1/START domain